ncbi:unnamed protein product [Pieris brassicae]|uniref:Uncharacterized protein n=1 Tax=Pieris brassicae TaxID=7116 RepID=A0A9P0TWU6_PIEBR|nr:unnamed protein product [Pieris brassicae]
MLSIHSFDSIYNSLVPKTPIVGVPVGITLGKIRFLKVQFSSRTLLNFISEERILGLKVCPALMPTDWSRIILNGIPDALTDLVGLWGCSIGS